MNMIQHFWAYSLTMIMITTGNHWTSHNHYWVSFFPFNSTGLQKISQRSFWIPLRLLYLDVALILILSLLLQPHTRLQVNFLYDKVSEQNISWNLNFQHEFWFTQKLRTVCCHFWPLNVNKLHTIFDQTKSHQTGS